MPATIRDGERLLVAYYILKPPPAGRGAALGRLWVALLDSLWKLGGNHGVDST